MDFEDLKKLHYVRYWLVLSIILLFSACYESKEGCLDIEASNYDVSADDQCKECCQYPKFSVQLQHYIVSPARLDSLFTMRYATKYQGLLDSNQFYTWERGRFFISDVKLVRVSGEEVGVQDSIILPKKQGDSVTVENNFSKHDRDLIQAATIGTMRTTGMFSGVKFTVGVPQYVLDEILVDSIKTSALTVRSDTIVFDSLTGIIPMRFMLKPDTLADMQLLDFQIKAPRQISLAFSQPVNVERGYNIKLVLGINYSKLLETVDFKHDTKSEIQAKIDNQLTNAFSIVSFKVE